MKNKFNWLSLRVAAGLALLLSGLLILSYSYGPLLVAEWQYYSQNQAPAPIRQVFQGDTEEKEIIPVDSNFGVIVPKIKANAPVVANVDPYNSQEYQVKLSQGVAHAKDTGFPDEKKGMFLFAHASGDILMARRYNAVFYLLNKLEQDDEVIVYYQDEPYYYQVTAIRETPADAVSYLENNNQADLILMTCTPPGTDWRRLLVLADKVKIND